LLPRGRSGLLAQDDDRGTFLQEPRAAVLPQLLIGAAKHLRPIRSVCATLA